jgi:uncharacterized damage-inducible protein DinB
MQLADHVRLMAEYNQWMNDKLYAACLQLSFAQLAEDRQAFFGSILKTLNHLIIADTLWLKRFSLAEVPCAALARVDALPTPETLDAVLFSDMHSLAARRKLLDETLLTLANTVTDAALQQTCHTGTSEAWPAKRYFSAC